MRRPSVVREGFAALTLALSLCMAAFVAQSEALGTPCATGITVADTCPPPFDPQALEYVGSCSKICCYPSECESATTYDEERWNRDVYWDFITEDYLPGAVTLYGYTPCGCILA